jgi:hypothetical protein
MPGFSILIQLIPAQSSDFLKARDVLAALAHWMMGIAAKSNRKGETGTVVYVKYWASVSFDNFQG